MQGSGSQKRDLKLKASLSVMGDSRQTSWLLMKSDFYLCKQTFSLLQREKLFFSLIVTYYVNVLEQRAQNKDKSAFNTCRSTKKPWRIVPHSYVISLTMGNAK
jgi:hypothetical protein